MDDIKVTGASLSRQGTGLRRHHLWVDLTGRRFGRLLVLSEAGRPNCWRCVCDCGKQSTPRGSKLLAGTTLSCGCLGAERRQLSTTTHRGSRTRLYRVWAGMHARCCVDSTDRADWAYYAGKGVFVCDEWRSFQAFRAWAMANGFADGMTIDRIDGDGPYSADNCRWISHAENSRNSSWTKLNANDVKQIKAELVSARRESMSAIAARFGVVVGAIYNIQSGRSWADVPWPDGSMGKKP